MSGILLPPSRDALGAAGDGRRRDELRSARLRWSRAATCRRLVLPPGGGEDPKTISSASRPRCLTSAALDDAADMAAAGWAQPAGVRRG